MDKSTQFSSEENTKKVDSPLSQKSEQNSAVPNDTTAHLGE